MANTTNFGWETPDDTDLVKDGASAIRTLGQAIDTSMADLEGGTTGQILSKTSNTDMDFTWIDQNTGDITGVTAGTGISGGGTSGTVTVTNSMATAIDAKGDLIAGTGADTFSRLGVGSNGQVLTADSTAATGIKWADSAAFGWTLLSTTTLSGAATTITTISQSYKELMIVIEDYYCAGAASLYFQLNADSTANAHHRYLLVAQDSTTNITVGSDSQVYWTYGTCAASDNNNTLTLKLPAYSNTSSRKSFDLTTEFQNNSSQKELLFGSGAFNSTSAISSIKIGTTSTWSQGTVKIYGS